MYAWLHFLLTVLLISRLWFLAPQSIYSVYIDIHQLIRHTSSYANLKEYKHTHIYSPKKKKHTHTHIYHYLLNLTRRSKMSKAEEQSIDAYGWAARDSSGILSPFHFTRRFVLATYTHLILFLLHDWPSVSYICNFIIFDI